MYYLPVTESSFDFAAKTLESAFDGSYEMLERFMSYDERVPERIARNFDKPRKGTGLVAPLVSGCTFPYGERHLATIKRTLGY